MKKLIYFILLLSIKFSFSQGVTSSSIGGRVLDSDGEPLAGSSILVIHEPTGSRYGVITDFDGFYRVSGLRPGGPYNLEISYLGFETFKKENLFVQLGATERINTILSTSLNELEEIVLLSSGESSDKTGSETSISREQIDLLPQASRSLGDFIRLSPFAQIDEGSDGFEISLAGMNNRYNAIYIDGAINNDNFGLAGSGTNGGQTAVSPFSVDAIETFQVQIAPFDVRIGGFAGGAINAVSRSGTNDFEASTYYFFRNQDLAGKTPGSLASSDSDRVKLPEFTSNTYGIRVGGPIVKDRLFYFINYERQEDETPTDFQFSTYRGDSSEAQIQSLANFVQSNYGYDVGQYYTNPTILESDKFTFKLDYNVDERNKLSLSARYIEVKNIEASVSSGSSIRYYNSSEFFPHKSTALSLKWDYQADNFSNNFIVGYTAVRDDRGGLGGEFPFVRIRDGAGNIFFGTEQASSANVMNFDQVSITNNLEIYSGKHTFTIGTHNEFGKAYNLFFYNALGYYEWNNLQGFLDNDITQQNNYQIGYSLLGGIGDNSVPGSAAEPELAQLGFYLQDEFQANDKLKLTAGVRLDIPIWNKGNVNEHFNQITIPLLEAEGKDLQGAKVGLGIGTRVYVSPRIGFNWDMKGDRSLIVRGGFGSFLSRIPLVWPSAVLNNDGQIGGYTFTTQGVPFTNDLNNLYRDPQPGTGELGGNVDLFTPDFKMPMKFKTSLAIDKLFENGLFLSLEGIYTKNLSDVYYQNINVKGAVGFLEGADNRPYYNRRDEVDDTYGRIMLGSNTNKGYAYNIAFTARKKFGNNLNTNLTFSYGDAYTIFDGTSSINSSQWRNMETQRGKNSTLDIARSDFAQGGRVIANVSYKKEWNNNLTTQIGVFYEGRNQSPFTYIYNDRSDLFNDDSRDNALMYVPNNASEINLTDPTQWSQLNQYISNNDYLNNRRGGYAERNGDMGPWSDIVDLRFVQDIAINTGKSRNTIQLTADIFNFSNLLNKDWGRKFSPGNQQILRTVTGAPNPEFDVLTSNFNLLPDDRGIQSSRWQAQLGLRYTFN